MTVEVRPFGVRCNIGCLYCYQNNQRDAGGPLKSRYDLEAIKSALLEEGEDFGMFGGEPLMMPKRDLETLFSWGLEQFGSNSIQTNGVLLDDDHIRMFKRCKVGVGISVDGPGSLNDARWNGTLAATRKATARTLLAIDALCAAGHPPTLMLQLTRCNALPHHLPIMADWLRSLDLLGVAYARLHILEIENDAVRKKLALSQRENIEAFRFFADLENSLESLRFDIFREQEASLSLQDGKTACVWRACDPYYTDAVHGIDGDGSRHNCGLTDKEGINYQKPQRQSFQRYLSLYHTPQEAGGCRGCRFFLFCKGQCPGTGIGGDWRLRSENCEVWKELFALAESRLLARDMQPLSLDARLPVFEGAMLAAWESGNNPTLTELEHELSPKEENQNESVGTAPSRQRIGEE